MTQITLESQIADIIGECEVERTRDGKFIVMYMNLVASPPPKGSTPEEAMEKFLEWYKEQKAVLSPTLPEVEVGHIDE